MAHGNMNTSPLYICTKSGKYIVRKEDWCVDDHFFYENDVIGCDGHKYFSLPDWKASEENGHPTSRWVRFREGMNINEERCWYELNIGYYGNYIYMQNFERYFRPVVGKHKEVLEFKNEKALNEWLLDKDPSKVEKIGIVKNKYSVVYLNDGDTEYTKDFN